MGAGESASVGRGGRGEYTAQRNACQSPSVLLRWTANQVRCVRPAVYIKRSNIQALRSMATATSHANSSRTAASGVESSCQHCRSHRKPTGGRRHSTMNTAPPNTAATPAASQRSAPAPCVAHASGSTTAAIISNATKAPHHGLRWTMTATAGAVRMHYGGGVRRA